RRVPTRQGLRPVRDNVLGTRGVTRQPRPGGGRGNGGRRAPEAFTQLTLALGLSVRSAILRLRRGGGGPSVSHRRTVASGCCRAGRRIAWPDGQGGGQTGSQR